MKKFCFGGLVFLTILFISCFVLMNGNFKLYEQKEMTTHSDAVAVFIEGDDGNYNISQDSNFPTKGYVLNTEKSSCKNGGSLSQDSVTKAINLSVSNADECTVYFDKAPLITSVEFDYWPWNINRIGITSITLNKNYDIAYYEVYVNGTGLQQLKETDIGLEKNTVAISENYVAGELYYYSVTAVLKDGTRSETYEGVYEYTCFVGDTLVHTNNGYTKIEDIKVGDLVYSYNEATGNIELNKVSKLFVHDDDKIYSINVGDETIEVTPDHRVFVKKQNSDIAEWIKIYDVAVGDMWYREDGTFDEITEINFRRQENKIKVYNLEVENNHTYFVTESDYLVHNAKSSTSGN